MKIFSIRHFSEFIKLKIEDFISDFRDLSSGGVYRSNSSNKSKSNGFSAGEKENFSTKKKRIKMLGRGRMTWTEED